MTPGVVGGAAVLPSHPALQVTGLSKTFAGPPALSSVDLTIQRGEIQALLGENGSGKSTFIKILAGYHRPDPGGEVLIDGHRLDFGSADASYGLGCRFVHQDLGLVETSSILDNLCLNTGFPCRFGTIRGRMVRQQAAGDLARVGLDLDPRLPVAGLSPALRTGVAVARALRQDKSVSVKLLVLDEPTATLPDHEVHQLLDIVRAVARTGIGVLYVTHRLDEVFELADNATVLRDGVKVATEPVSALDRKRLITLLVGSELEEAHAASAALHSERGDPIFEVRDLVDGPLTGVSFQARSGDIIGFAGITGSGRETILGALFGATALQAGTVSLDGKTIPSLNPNAAMAARMAFLPAERKTLGSIQEFSARENLTLSDVRRFWRPPLLNRQLEVDEARTWFKRVNVRPSGTIEARLATFSGGNQQKVCFAKWLRLEPRVLLLDEPTQGVDVGAKAELHRHLLAAAAEGAAVILSSSDVDELVALCHRVLVLRDGRIVAELIGSGITVANISRQSLGTDQEALPV